MVLSLCRALREVDGTNPDKVKAVLTKLFKCLPPPVREANHQDTLYANNVCFLQSLRLSTLVTMLDKGIPTGDSMMILELLQYGQPVPEPPELDPAQQIPSVASPAPAGASAEANVVTARRSRSSLRSFPQF